MYEPVSDEEYKRLKSIPFDQLSDNEKVRLNFRIMDDLPEEQASFLFERAMQEVFGDYKIIRKDE